MSIWHFLGAVALAANGIITMHQGNLGAALGLFGGAMAFVTLFLKEQSK